LAGAEAALGAYKLVVCLAPDDVPPGTPGRSPNGARLLDATFTVDNVFTVPAGQSIWKAFTTPYAAGIGAPNAAGTVETRAVVADGAITMAKKLYAKQRIVVFTGKVTQGGAPVARAKVTLLINGKSFDFGIRTNAAGTYKLPLKRKGPKGTVTFQARTTVAERDITSTGCASPTPGIPGGCVNATASAFTAVSAKIRLRI
jgi:hypothetical protein